MNFSESIEIFDLNILSIYFNLTKNTGIAFGLFSESLMLISIFSVIFLLSIAIYLYFRKLNLKLWMIFIISGGIGNLIDRIFFQGVVDFIECRMLNKTLFIFNIADFCITLGVAIYAIDLFKKKP